MANSCSPQLTDSTSVLQANIDEVNRALLRHGLPFGAKSDTPRPLDTYQFSHDDKVCKIFWDVRKGLIPIVGAAREPGTSMLIEDVACPVDKLADMMIDLIEMFNRYGYPEASCFGHALEGNLHLVFAQVRRHVGWAWGWQDPYAECVQT